MIPEELWRPITEIKEAGKSLILVRFTNDEGETGYSVQYAHLYCIEPYYTQYFEFIILKEKV